MFTVGLFLKKWFGEALKWNGGGEEEGEDKRIEHANILQSTFQSR
jgi:hypothetical protein